jgi:hypothetical protein
MQHQVPYRLFQKQHDFSLQPINLSKKPSSFQKQATSTHLHSNGFCFAIW